MHRRLVTRQMAATSGRLNAMSTGQEPLEMLPEQGETEVQHLLASFNRLTRELVAKRDHLEELVQQRTSELEIKERFLQVLVDALPGLVSYWKGGYFARAEMSRQLLACMEDSKDW